MTDELAGLRPGERKFRFRHHTKHGLPRPLYPVKKGAQASLRSAINKGMTGDLHFTPNATFSALRGVPLLALTRNSLYPELTIGADSLTIRVIRRHRLPFSAIREVGVRWRLAYQLTIVPERGLRTFVANFLSREVAARVVAALAQRGVALDAADFLGTDSLGDSVLGGTNLQNDCPRP